MGIHIETSGRERENINKFYSLHENHRINLKKFPGNNFSLSLSFILCAVCTAK